MRKTFQIRQAVPCTCLKSSLPWEFTKGKFTKNYPMFPYTIKENFITYKCPNCSREQTYHVDDVRGSSSYPKIMLNSFGYLRWKCPTHGVFHWTLKSTADDLMVAMQEAFNINSQNLYPCCASEEIKAKKLETEAVGNTCIKCGIDDSHELLIQLPVSDDSKIKRKVYFCPDCLESTDISRAFCSGCHLWDARRCGVYEDDLYVLNIDEVNGKSVYTLANTYDYCDKTITL